jgi:hypothetical protein
MNRTNPHARAVEKDESLVFRSKVRDWIILLKNSGTRPIPMEDAPKTCFLETKTGRTGLKDGQKRGRKAAN